ncbi:MAG: cytochrome c oxidase subunit 3, partial [Acidimicrobiales bacterium]
MATEMLALAPTGGGGVAAEQRRMTLPLAVLVAGAGVAMLFGGLVAAYLALTAAPGQWPPKDTEFDNYTAGTLTITVMMAAVTVEWAAYGIRKGFRGQALFGFGLTVGLAVAFLNGLAFLINGFSFTGGESPYATVVYALTGSAFAVGVVALGGVLLTAVRAMGHQLTTDNYHLRRATAYLWHIAAAGWVIVY